ncbi:hypothetical protein RHMOL_Rhmol01G0321700 [Rhododendron molle]|uniref:Uncharacterized protein n=1 Tax=Rhododendron molle TaxID=49168 RepID=A0ACC0Q7N5_RHOML|nr:hypothetical protein RHMOL_Rhmol01G0321700 [Rhododendron molle]
MGIERQRTLALPISNAKQIEGNKWEALQHKHILHAIFYCSIWYCHSEVLIISPKSESANPSHVSPVRYNILPLSPRTIIRYSWSIVGFVWLRF